MNRLQPCAYPSCKNLIDTSTGNPKRYCSAKCKQRAYNDRLRSKKTRPIEMLRVCLNCPKQFIAKTNAHKFCSASCRSSHWQQQNRLKLRSEEHTSELQ